MNDVVTLVAVGVTGWAIGLLHARKIIRDLNREIGRWQERQNMMDQVLQDQRDELEVLYSMDDPMEVYLSPEGAAQDEALMTIDPETDSKH